MAEGGVWGREGEQVWELGAHLWWLKSQVPMKFLFVGRWQ